MIFVCNELITGGPRHSLLEGQRCLGRAKTVDRHAIMRPYPGSDAFPLYDATGFDAIHRRIVGEIYDCGSMELYNYRNCLSVSTEWMQIGVLWQHEIREIKTLMMYDASRFTTMTNVSPSELTFQP